jgi:CRP/FNR family transcriptional regulator, cyclic AMP receptor protein
MAVVVRGRLPEAGAATTVQRGCKRRGACWTLAPAGGGGAGRRIAAGKEAGVVSTMGTRATVDRLRAVDPLHDCTDAQLEEVAHLAERVQVAEGEVLAREERIGREFFLILSGRVAVTQKGREVNTLGPGDFFGELAAVNPGPRNATVTALSELDMLIIGPREFSAMAAIPGFRDALFRSMAGRLRTMDARLAAALEGQQPPAAGSDDAERA